MRSSCRECECVAACDLYDGRHTLARELVSPSLPTTRRYQDLLENKDIDCLVAAVPDHWHKQIVVDAVAAGKDIYCEKPMSHTAMDGVEMVAAAQENGTHCAESARSGSVQSFAPRPKNWWRKVCSAM